MTAEYTIHCSNYQTAVDYSKEIGLDIKQWQWIRDKFNDPICYKRYKPNNTGWGNQ